ncbi:uncharacterized protein LOC120152866 [Hibiscus syriacus]|uniref:uncharacterized protein LOC120152866 n=1 Tax=Hibiscus syriacus TaxID=106335 RepID=UPI0019250DC7|nr:uncharacterized protein LOC120152866 [Hibiscus syriacus]
MVMKEIIKWLDAGVIYPISNSSWVSRMQYVPNNGGVTVVSNENNKLFPTRTVTGWRIYVVEDFLEIFMDDFFVSGDNFDKCLGNLAKHNQPFLFDKEYYNAFTELKEILVTGP